MVAPLWPAHTQTSDACFLSDTAKYHLVVFAHALSVHVAVLKSQDAGERERGMEDVCVHVSVLFNLIIVLDIGCTKEIPTKKFYNDGVQYAHG